VGGEGQSSLSEGFLADSHLKEVSLCDGPLPSVGWNPDEVRNQLSPTLGSPDPGNPGLWDETPMASGDGALRFVARFGPKFEAFLPPKTLPADWRRESGSRLRAGQGK